MKTLSVSLAAAVALGASSFAVYDAPTVPREDRIARHYKVEKIMGPLGIDSQVGGLAVLGDGRLVAAFHHGQVATYDPKDQSWKIIAEGLHEPLGILPEKEGTFLVMQRPELTRLRDTDGDGVIDQYETVWDDFGLSGNYHEFAFGPALGPNGKLYVGLNVASSGDSIRKEIRGEWSPIGLPRQDFYGPDWKKVSEEAGRMYSRVPWRGWIMELDPSTGEATPFASGVRSPDGLGFDAEGNLLVSDNQGDWRGSSEMFVVKKDGFYGHPASLVWRKDWDGSEPLKVPIARLDALRTPAAVWFPHNIYANSPTQPVLIPKTPAWGAFGGQVLIGEMNSPRLLRILMEEVDGVWQGACVNLVDSETLKRGLHRLAFIGDTLYIGRTHLSWAGAEGLVSLKPEGALPFDPLDIHVTPSGFRVDFTEPLSAAAADPASWSVEHYTYAYHIAYGSPQMEKGTLTPIRVQLSNGNRTAEIDLPVLKENFVYDLHLEALRSESGNAPLNGRLAYTLRKIPKK
jgi:hypothetical protein